MSAFFKLSGKITDIYPTETKTNNFISREIIVSEVGDPSKPWLLNVWRFEFWTKDTVIPDSYAVGDFVTLYFDIKGKPFVNRVTERNTASVVLKCWNIEKDGVLYRPI